MQSLEGIGKPISIASPQWRAELISMLSREGKRKPLTLPSRKGEGGNFLLQLRRLWGGAHAKG